MTVDPQAVEPKNVKPQIPHLRARDPQGLSKVPFITGAIRHHPSHSSSSHAFSNILSLRKHLTHSYDNLRFSENFSFYRHKGIKTSKFYFNQQIILSDSATNSCFFCLVLTLLHSSYLGASLHLTFHFCLIL